LSYAPTFPAKRVPRGTAAAKAVVVESAEKLAAFARSEEKRAAVTYYLFLLFTFFLYARPTDFWLWMAVIPIAQIIALSAMAMYAVSLVFGRAPLLLTREVKLVLALTALFLAGIPGAFWRARAYEVFSDTWIKTLITFWLLSQTAFTASRVRKIIWVIIISILLVGAVTYLSPQRYYMQQGRLKGAGWGFLSGNYLGPAVGSMLPFMAVFLARRKSLIAMGTVLLTFGVSMLMVVDSASRSNLLVVLVGLGLTWRYLLRKNARARIVGIILALAILITVLAAPGVFWARMQTLWTDDNSGNYASQSAQFSEEQRKGLFWRSVEYSFKNPLLGLGMGNFAIASGALTGKASEWMGTHNAFTQVSSEGGLPALVVFLTLTVGCAWRMRKLARETEQFKDEERTELHYMALATKVSIYAFLFSGMFAHLAYDFHFYYLAGIAACLEMHWERIRGTLPPPVTAGNGGNGSRPLPVWKRGASAAR